MEFESVLHQIGDYGLYQKRLLMCVLVPISLLGPFISDSVLLMLSEPDHWCVVPEVRNLSWSDQHLLVRPAIQGSSRADSCNYNDIDYEIAIKQLNDYKVTHNSTDKFTFDNISNKTKSCSSWIYDNSSYDANAITEFNLVCEDRNLKSSLLSMTGVAGMLGAFFFGYTSSRFGRKKMMLIAILFTYITIILPMFVLEKWIFLGSRVFASFFMVGISDQAFLIMSELVKPEVRSSVIATTATCWTIGMCILPLATALIRNWLGLLSIPAVLMIPWLSFIWFVPESPRWLVSKRRYKDAHQVLSHIARVNGNVVSGDLIEQLKIINAVPRKMSKLSISGKNMEETSSPFEIFRHPRLRLRFTMLIVAWISAYSTYGGLTLNFENFEGNEFMNWFLLSLVEFPSNLVSWYFMESVIGRRWTTAGSLMLGGIALCAPVIMSSDTMILVMSLVGKFLTNIAFNVLYQQAVEIFPTPIRSQAGSYATAIASAACLGLPFVISLGKGHVWIPLMIIGLVSILGGVVTSFFPETLDQNLPQTIEDGEKLGQNRKFFSLAVRQDMQRRRSQEKPRRSITLVNMQ